ncbi:hypothetical protein [Hymenobacter mucosus]|uniref:Uncharacterized protein n=1 Tax=Hymenobacter mucosus TaxID=1411120 RepID=A0A239AAL6_9BACT|nr:hypothetical protein [Hymenobacter mucosus]SNR92579.1 hypothetical protein SAMN06269173_111108 [Hymenobacter mucosus]
MQTATTKATTATVAQHLPAYTGPLGRFLQRQEEVKQAAQQAETLRAMRANIMAVMNDAYLFSEVELLRANDSVYQCECVAQLQRWFRNVYRVYQEREASLRMGFADGSYVHIPVQA